MTQVSRRALVLGLGGLLGTRIPLSLARMAAKIEGWVASRGEGRVE